MIVASMLILFYLKISKPFYSNFNNYFAGLNQLFLALYYIGCLVLTVDLKDNYSNFRETLGLCLTIAIITNLIFHFVAGLMIYFR